MSGVYENLYQNEGLTRVSPKRFLEDLADIVSQPIANPNQKVKTPIEIFW